MPSDVAFRISVRDMPVVLADLRREMADILRERAEEEPSFVRQKLLEIAADFEAGVSR